MTADVRQQLTEALDGAAGRARALLVQAQRVSLTLKEPRLLGREIPGWHEWPDVEAMCARELRSIERDRALIERHKPELSGSGEPGLWCAGCDSNYEQVAECPELLAAAAFWLGTPEADRG